jgi:hypothetical protein
MFMRNPVLPLTSRSQTNMRIAPLVLKKQEMERSGMARNYIKTPVTHYNYFFNADNRLNDIIARAKEANTDDYTQLLPYYDYSLDVTSADQDLDSIIYKCNAGILLHDLRNDWIDDMYFLMGKAYYLRKNFDSAERVFLYLNYAFAPKDDGYDIPMGSNVNGKVFQYLH